MAPRAPLINNFSELLRACDVADLEDLQDYLYEAAQFEYDLWGVPDDEGVEFIAGRNGTLIPYPFGMSEVWEVLHDLDARAEESEG